MYPIRLTFARAEERNNNPVREVFDTDTELRKNCVHSSWTRLVASASAIGVAPEVLHDWWLLAIHPRRIGDPDPAATLQKTIFEITENRDCSFRCLSCLKSHL